MIIGGGVNGLCSAYYLSQSGYDIEVIDPGFSAEGTSYGNAGMIVPSHFIPMASPGIISKGLKWMFNASSPFYIKPRLDWRLIQWLWRFNKSCSSRNVERSQELIWKYNELSKQEYAKLAQNENLNFDFHQRGLMMLFKSEKSKAEEIEIAQKANEIGIEAKVLDQSQVQSLNPDVKVDVLGGVYFPEDAHLYSNHFMRDLMDLLTKRGVKLTKDSVIGTKMANDRITALTTKNGKVVLADHFIITAGAWSWKILKMLGIKLLLEDGKGYSITQKSIDIKPTIPAILTDEKVAITPMGDDLRITGTLEISGISTKINHKRVHGFLSAVPKYFPDMKVPDQPAVDEIWTGYRPLSFDGVPYVGRSKSIANLVVATGHGMMGMSLGPATGKLVAQIVNQENTDLDLELMRLGR